MGNEIKKPNKRQIQHNKTLVAIRKAVDELVREVGFENMRIVDVVSRVGIAEGTFYYYFKTKNELLHDRLYRSNGEIWAYYEDTLSGMNELEALKAFLFFIMEYGRTRVVEVHTCYLKAMLDNYEEWDLANQQAIGKVLRKLVEEGQEKGRIKRDYTCQQIVDFLNCYFSGAVYTQCLTRGVFLENTQSVAIVLDWIESLRPCSVNV